MASVIAAVTGVVALVLQIKAARRPEEPPVARRSPLGGSSPALALCAVVVLSGVVTRVDAGIGCRAGGRHAAGNGDRLSARGGLSVHLFLRAGKCRKSSR